MSCTNCFNGCAEIKSDQCVKYTGSNIPSLGISGGDPLSTIIEQLTTYLLDAIDGSGIEPDVSDTCSLIAGYLGTGTTLNDFISALIQASCNLQSQITVIDATLTTLNGDYDVDCLSGVTDSSDTHAVLQAVITKLCATEVTLTALSNTVSTNYVKIADLNSLITAYLASAGVYYYTRMIPNTAVEYYGSLSNFDASGAGIGNWLNIYLCNGNNGTPDKRGRVTVCATTGMAGGTYTSAVDPSDPANPTYNLKTIKGENNVTFTSATQIPPHTHLATVSVTDPTHTHYVAVNDLVGPNQILSTSNSIKNYAGGIGSPSSGNYYLQGVSGVASIGKTSAASTGLDGNITVSNAHVGGSASHNNIQPSIAAYYIMYIPSS